jgi:NADPH:quinone reductase-like Zn-dependent oxidoreductase
VAEAARKPERLSHRDAAAVPLTALTAWQALFDTAKLEKRQTVLIHAGGVGTMAVQLAKWKARASSPPPRRRHAAPLPRRPQRRRRVSHTFPLERAKEAHEQSESRSTRGKIVLELR